MSTRLGRSLLPTATGHHAEIWSRKAPPSRGEPKLRGRPRTNLPWTARGRLHGLADLHARGRLDLAEERLSPFLCACLLLLGAFKGSIEQVL